MSRREFGTRLQNLTIHDSQNTPKIMKVLNILKLTRISILILANLTLLLFKEQIYLNY